MLFCSISIAFEYLVCPSRYDEDNNGTCYRCCDNGEELGFYHVEIQHKCNAWRHEEEAEVGYQEVADGLDPFLLYDFCLQQECKQQHAYYAAGYRDACEPDNQLAECQASEYDKTLSDHFMQA